MSASSGSIPLLIKSPHSPDYVLSTSVPSHFTVLDVKAHLSSTYRGSPAVGVQWLVCAGRLLANEQPLSELLASQAGAGAGEELILHLAIKQQRTVPPSAAVSPSQQQQPQEQSVAAPSSSASAAFAASSSPVAPAASPVSTSREPGAADISLTAAAAGPSPFLAPLAGYGVWPYGVPSAHQLQLAWQWQQQQMAAAAQLGGLRQRQVSAPSTRSSSTASFAPTNSALPAALFPAVVPGATATLRGLPSPFYMSQFGLATTSLIAPQFAFPPSALPQFAASSVAALPATASLSASSSAFPVSIPHGSASSSNPSALPSTSSLPFASSSHLPSSSSEPEPSSTSAVSAAPARAAPASLYVAAVRRYVDVRLLVKLSVLLLVFSRQGDSTRSLLLLGAAVLAYAWQVGLLRRRGREADGLEQADGQPNQREAGAAEREAVAHARREAREERRAGAAAVPGGGRGGGGGLGGLLAGMAGEAEEDDEDDINLQREQLHIIQQQHQAELIRRGQRQSESGEVNQQPVQLDTWLSASEKLVVGLFASLVPSWRPTIDVQ